MTEELLAKVREAQSPEELLTLMRENGIEDFTKEDAEELYTEMHTTGELTDEEMENVSAGVRVSGTKYKGVLAGYNCFTGQWACGFSSVNKFTHVDNWGHAKIITAYSVCRRSDNKSLRKTWAAFSVDNQCGSCIHLGFKAGTGYCEVAPK